VEIQEDPAPGVPEWVVTYGDMMSMLLTFFIMLVSMSELREEGKNRAALDAIREAFGADIGSSGVPGTSMQTNSVLNKRNSKGSRSQNGLKRGSRNSDGRSGANATVNSINDGSKITLGGPALFGQFEPTLSAGLKANLTIIARVLKTAPNKIIVRGHASPQPIPLDSPYSIEWQKRTGRAPDQMDLSFARANAAAKFLVQQGIDDKRLVVSAAGDSELRVRSRDPKRQRENRRVDVFLIDSYIPPRK